MTSAQEIMEIKPTFIPVSDGTWLAVAGPTAIVRVGALEDTQDAARASFEAALQRFADALEET